MGAGCLDCCGKDLCCLVTAVFCRVSRRCAWVFASGLLALFEVDITWSHTLYVAVGSFFLW